MWSSSACSWASAGPAPSSPHNPTPTALIFSPAAAYPTHVPLTGLQQGALTVLSALGALASPRRADLVAAVGETSAGPALAALRRRMTLDPRGADILAERPRVTDALLRRAAALPPDTFGGAYAAFMGTRGFSADERPPVRFVADAELAYIVTRAREVHDFWHVLFGCHTNVQGEVALKAVEFLQVRGGAGVVSIEGRARRGRSCAGRGACQRVGACSVTCHPAKPPRSGARNCHAVRHQPSQTGLPMTALAVVAGELRLPAEQRAELNRTYLPWALQAGAQAADLMCIPYEKHLEVCVGGC